PDPTRRSRGQLCLELLASRDAETAAARAAAEPAGRYNPYNLLLADVHDAWVVSQRADEQPHRLRLDAGLHLVTNLDVNDPTCPRIAGSRARFAAAGEPFARDGDVEALVERLRDVLADHATAADPRAPESLCVHHGPYGTRSASVLVVGADGRPHYFHA